MMYIVWVVWILLLSEVLCIVLWFWCGVGVLSLFFCWFCGRMELCFEGNFSDVFEVFVLLGYEMLVLYVLIFDLMVVFFDISVDFDFEVVDSILYVYFFVFDFICLEEFGWFLMVIVVLYDWFGCCILFYWDEYVELLDFEVV